jgi:hypothetical protein
MVPAGESPQIGDGKRAFARRYHSYRGLSPAGTKKSDSVVGGREVDGDDGSDAGGGVGDFDVGAVCGGDFFDDG